MTEETTLLEQIKRERLELVADMEARRRATEAEEVLATARQAIAPATKSYSPPIGSSPPSEHQHRRRPR